MSCDNLECPNTLKIKYNCDLCPLASYCSPECKLEDYTHAHRYLCAKNGPWDISNFVSEPTISLGKGILGEVKLLVHRQSSQPFALKEMKKTEIHQQSLLKEVFREIEIHQHLSHPNILRIYTHFEDSEQISMVLQYAPNGTLFRHIRNSQHIDEADAWQFFTQTLQGVYYLHSHGLIHRDIKPENLLLDKNNVVKISDFGLCVSGDAPRTTLCGTTDYMAPEIFARNGYSYEVDVWALGVLLYQLLHGRPPFQSAKQADTIYRIHQNRVEMRESLTLEVRDLIASLLQTDPQQRLPLIEIFRHPWVTYHAPEFDLSVGQSLIHSELGMGSVADMEGLLCSLSFGGVQKLCPVAQVYDSCQIETVDASESDRFSMKEDKIFRKIQKMASGLDRSSLRASRVNKSTEILPAKPEPSPRMEVLDQFQDCTETFYVEDFDDPAAGLLDSLDLKQLEEGRALRNLLGEDRGVSPRLKSIKKQAVKLQSQKLEALDTSVDILKQREHELEQLCSMVQGREEKEMKPILKKKKTSFFSYLFGCGSR